MKHIINNLISEVGNMQIYTKLDITVQAAPVEIPGFYWCLKAEPDLFYGPLESFQACLFDYAMYLEMTQGKQQEKPPEYNTDVIEVDFVARKRVK